jgi:hypothetical protein
MPVELPAIDGRFAFQVRVRPLPDHLGEPLFVHRGRSYPQILMWALAVPKGQTTVDTMTRLRDPAASGVDQQAW